MNNPNNSGNAAISATAIPTNGSKSIVSYSDKEWGAIAYQTVREVLPTVNPESDLAVKVKVELLTDLCREVGPEQLMAAVKKAISISHKRYDCSIARIRECAGLRYTPAPSATSLAWEFVTRVFVDHCRQDTDGNYRLEEKVVMRDGVAEVTPVPAIPEPIKRALRCLGGWAAIAEAWPEYATQKWMQFKEMYSEEMPSSPRMDQPEPLKILPANDGKN